MERVVYSPTLEQLPEAEEIAKQTMLPILVGDSLNTEHINFNRNNVQVLELPRIKEIYLSGNSIRSGMHQTVFVSDEFCGKNISQYSAIYKGENVSPMYVEKHKIKWSFFCSGTGESSVSIFFNNEKVEELKFDVY
jgi:hypothetical protein